MRNENLILSGLIAVGLLAIGGQPVQAASYHNGNPKIIRGYWRMNLTHDSYYLFHFYKTGNVSQAVVKTKHRGWHKVSGEANPNSTFNYQPRYRKLNAHTYYVIPTKKSRHDYPDTVGATAMKINKKTSHKIAVKYHYTKYGWSHYQWLYRK